MLTQPRTKTELAQPLSYHDEANAASSNRIVNYWLLMIVSRNYGHTTDASVGTNVVSSLLTAVAFLCFPTCYVRCQQCMTAHTQETDSDTALVIHLPSIFIPLEQRI